MPKGMSLEDQLITFKETVSNLKVLEVKYKKEDLALILLYFLPSSYFRDTILNSHNTLTPDEICDALSSEEQMNKQVVGSLHIRPLEIQS